MASQSIVYRIASIIQTLSIVAGALLMLATVIGEKLNLHYAAFSGLLVGLCFFLIAASSAIKTFNQR